MGWYTWAVDGAKNLSSQLSTGAVWVWNNASISKITVAVASYPVNVGFEILEQVMALKKAVPNLIYVSASRETVGKMAYIVVTDILPLVLLNSANNSVQAYWRSGDQYEDSPLLGMMYSLSLGALTLADYGIFGYTQRQGIQATVRMGALVANAPAAFSTQIAPPEPIKADPKNSKHKDKASRTICEISKCNYKRKLKGTGLEAFILFLNDVMIGAMRGYIPYAGPFMADVATVVFAGRYLVRLTTAKELCEKHRLANVRPESSVALGITYQATNMLMDSVLQSTVGMPPYLYHRAMRQMILLFYANIAANMTLSHPPGTKFTLNPAYDPFNIIERASRFVGDVLIAGMMKQIPKEFPPGAKPFIPLSVPLNYATRWFESGQITANPTENPGFFSKSLTMAKRIILPPVLQDMKGFSHDPVIGSYWANMQAGAVDIVKIIEHYGKMKAISMASGMPKTVASALHLKWGLPKRLVILLLELTQMEDLWKFAAAFRLWLKLQGVSEEVSFSGSDIPLLFGPSKPALKAEAPTGSPQQLTRNNSGPRAARPEDLVRSAAKEPAAAPPVDLVLVKTEAKVTGDKASAPDALMPIKKKEETVRPVIHTAPKTETRAAPPDGFFYLRRKQNNTVTTSPAPQLGAAADSQ